jgi:hypothetical protein
MTQPASIARNTTGCSTRARWLRSGLSDPLLDDGHGLEQDADLAQTAGGLDDELDVAVRVRSKMPQAETGDDPRRARAMLRMEAATARACRASWSSP